MKYTSGTGKYDCNGLCLIFVNLRFFLISFKENLNFSSEDDKKKMGSVLPQFSWRKLQCRNVVSVIPHKFNLVTI